MLNIFTRTHMAINLLQILFALLTAFVIPASNRVPPKLVKKFNVNHCTFKDRHTETHQHCKYEDSLESPENKFLLCKPF